MNNSILMFAAGAVVGIAGTLLIPAEQAAQTQDLSTTDNTTLNSQLSEITKALESLNATTTDLQDLVQKYTYVLPATPATNPGHAQASAENDTNTADSNNNSSFEQFMDQLQNVQRDTVAKVQPIVENTPPTQAQIEQYHSIETRLYAAMNNKSANLSRLLQDANQLTRIQREDLTSKAMEMIKNGEITADQFNPPSGI